MENKATIHNEKMGKAFMEGFREGLAETEEIFYELTIADEKEVRLVQKTGTAEDISAEIHKWLCGIGGHISIRVRPVSYNDDDVVEAEIVTEQSEHSAIQAGD